jgi:hypothetical protein
LTRRFGGYRHRTVRRRPAGSRNRNGRFAAL